MPRWGTRPLFVYHGTDSASVGIVGRAGSPIAFVPSVARCATNTDFGQGFYTTTHLHQAEQWANTKVLRAKPTGTFNFAVVLRFVVSWDALAALENLAFVRPTRDFWNLVTDCRHGFPPHQRPGSQRHFDVVLGPVTLWQQILTINDCDQISFHSAASVALLSGATLHRASNGFDPTKAFF